jgi:hypothetical protein
MLFFESRVASVIWNADLEAVELRWKMFAKGEEFKEALNQGLELVRQKKAAHWLGDTSDMSAIPLEDQEWVNTNWFPRAISSGIKRMAVIVPKSAIAKMSVQNIVSRFNTLEVHNFGEKSEAAQWLKSQE